MAPACNCVTVTPDAGNVEDAGFTDAGGTPQPEVCDGVDNDLNGTVDDGSDGGALDSSCPLDVGVCAAARSSCVNGSWTGCDYGSDYQLTETMCDGLDNDCDGRADISWERVLVGGQLWLIDLWQAEVISRAGGLWLSTASRLVSLSGDLELLAGVDFPSSSVVARVFPQGNGWFRLANEADCLIGHEIFADGGFPTQLDGGIRVRGKVCLPPFRAPVGDFPFAFGASQMDDGFAAYMKSKDYGNEAALVWAWFGFDGGFLFGAVDAGQGSSVTPVPVRADRGQLKAVVPD